MLDLGAVRAELPSLAGGAYLNTGGCGPFPVPAAMAIARWGEEAARRHRGSGPGFGALEDEVVATRAAAGRVLGAPASEMVLCDNTTAGLNVALWGVDWRRGDEIVIPALEHPGLTVPVAVIARRHGVVVRWIDPEGMAADIGEEVARVAGPRTRVVALSHVSWATGQVLDVASAARAARAAGALTVVDGAQSAGAIPVDVADLGVDAYAIPAHKWLLGPEGIGALWVAPAAMERIDLTASGFESGAGHGPEGVIAVHPDARRYQVSTGAGALAAAWRAALAWLEGLGWDAVHAQILNARETTREALGRIEGVGLVTPPGPRAGLVTFTVRGWDPAAACARLAEDGVVVRWLERPAALRASTGCFTDAGDVRRLVQAVGALARDGC